MKHSEDKDLDLELRRHRPEPSRAFSARFQNEFGRMSVGRPPIARRATLAAVFTVGMLTTFASFGGIGYAASTAQTAFHASKVERLVGVSHGSPSKASPASTGSQASAGDDNPSQDQYRPGKGCGDKNHIHLRENECKKPAK